MRRRGHPAELPQEVEIPAAPEPVYRRERVVLTENLRRIRFMRLPNAPVLKLEVDDGRDLTGAFVRYAPKLRRSEREAFSVRAAETAMRERGARVAVASPVLLPDEGEVARYAPSSFDARDEVRAWFAGDDTDDGRAALERCLRILDEVGF